MSAGSQPHRALRGDGQNCFLSVCLSDSVCLYLRLCLPLSAFVSDCPWFSVSVSLFVCVCPSMYVSLLLPLSVPLLLSVSFVSESVASVYVYVCLFLSLSVYVSALIHVC